MTATSAKENLGLNTKIVSVGDKWIGHFDEGEMLVGLESSGHLIYPIHFTNDSGQKVTLRSGIGLLTGLMSLIAVKTLELPAERIIRPFEPGFSKTFYVFFVDKTRFYHNSPVWQQDYEILEHEISTLIDAGTLPSDTQLVVEEKEDINVLYVNFIARSGLLGCIFTRNSGTEDKNAIYVKGQPELKTVLLSLGKCIQNNHMTMMKNMKRIEYTYEQIILDILKKQSQQEIHALKTHLESELQQAVSENDLFGVLYGLKKEDRITLSEQFVSIT